MDAWVWVVIIAVIAALVVLAAAAGAMLQSRRRQSERLRGDFGPEYDRAVGEYGDERSAERALRERKQRVEKLRLRPLSAGERGRFSEAWTGAQTRFVDDPNAAIGDANRLVDEAMRARGYPVGDFDQRAADISVDHPYVVEHYRAARDIARRNERGEAETEDLRQAMVHYRSLFTELLNTPGDVPEAEPTDGRRGSPASQGRGA